jgi:hypothetical protein
LRLHLEIIGRCSCPRGLPPILLPQYFPRIVRSTSAAQSIRIITGTGPRIDTFQNSEYTDYQRVVVYLANGCIRSTAWSNKITFVSTPYMRVRPFLRLIVRRQTTSNNARGRNIVSGAEIRTAALLSSRRVGKIKWYIRLNQRRFDPNRSGTRAWTVLGGAPVGGCGLPFFPLDVEAAAYRTYDSYLPRPKRKINS